MRSVYRAAASVALLVAAAAAVAASPLYAVLWVAAGAAVHAGLCVRGQASLARLLPALSFVGVLAAFQAVFAGKVTVTPVRAAAVLLLATAGARLLPLDGVLRYFHPRSRWYVVALYLLLLRHFVRIFAEEFSRLLRAHALAAPCRFRRGWFVSLVHAAASVFPRALDRAERTYAGLVVRGIGG